MAFEVWRQDDFSGGEMYSVRADRLAPNQMSRIKNMWLRPDGSLYVRPSGDEILPIANQTGFNAIVWGAIKTGTMALIDGAGSNQEPISKYLMILNTSGTPPGEAGNWSFSQFNAINPTGHSTVRNIARTSFFLGGQAPQMVQAGNVVFWSAGKYSGYWSYTATNTHYCWTQSEIPEPYTGLNISQVEEVAGSTFVVATGTRTHSYKMTYYEPLYGIESNPGVATDITFGVGSWDISMTLPYLSNPAYLTASVRTKWRLYRMGPNDTTYKFVKEGSFTGASPGVPEEDVIDDVPDDELGTQAPFDHDRIQSPYFVADGTPDETPVLVYAAAWHNNRLWVAAGGHWTDSTVELDPAIEYEPWSRLYFSNLNNPFHFGRQLVTQLDAEDPSETRPANEGYVGGYFDINEDSSDRVIALSSWGSTLVVFRQKSIYRVEGFDWQSGFRVTKWYDIGIWSPRAHCQVNGRMFFMGSDGYIYEAGEAQPSVINRGVEGYWSPLINQDDLFNTLHIWMAYYDNKLIVGYSGWVPANHANTSSRVKAYDFRFNCWTDMSDDQYFQADNDVSLGTPYSAMSYYQVISDYSHFVFDPTVSLGSTNPFYLKQYKARRNFQWLVGTAPAFGSNEGGTTFVTPRSLFARTDQKLPIILRSGLLDFGNRRVMKRLRSARVYGKLTSGDAASTSLQGAPRLIVTAYQGEVADDQEFELTEGNWTVLETTSISLEGEMFRWEIRGPMASFELSAVEFEWSPMTVRVS